MAPVCPHFAPGSDVSHAGNWRPDERVPDLVCRFVENTDRLRRVAFAAPVDVRLRGDQRCATVDVERARPRSRAVIIGRSHRRNQN